MICTFTAAAIGLHLATWHDQPGFETATPGIYAVDTAGCTAGALRNSEGRASAYAGYTWRWGPVALTAGAISGYGGIKPLVLPSVAIGPLRIVAIPRLGNVSAAAGLHVALEVPL